MLLVRDANGKQNVASLTVFALHLDTVGGTEFSADYPFYLERTLRQSLGNECVSLFGTGTCGDINHVDVSHDRPQKGHAEAARIGTALAETVARGIEQVRPIAQPNLAVRNVVLQVPLQQYSAEETAAAEQNLAKVGTGALPFLEQVAACKIMELRLIDKDHLPMEVQIFRLSDDVALVGLPGEIFVDLGLAIKQGSPFKQTFVVELSQDSPGYVPTRKAFAEGSYETVNSVVKPGGGEMLVEGALGLLRDLAAKKK
jgi:hypothetical protein